MGWLSEAGARVGENLKRSFAAEYKRPSAASHLGILAFETAKTMSQLVSLYKSLDDAEIRKLKKEVIKFEGVSFLNSKDEAFLLSLAYAERLENLDKAANTVFRLGLKCSDFGLNRFDIVYNDLKLGIIDFGKLGYGSKETEKRIEKMEKLISATSRLYAALEALSELEVSERKLKQWKQNNKAAIQLQPTNFEHFEQKISHQRKQVRHFREISLWSQTFDKSVSLMARIVCVVYGRVSIVFGNCISFPAQLSTRNIRSSQQLMIKSQPPNSRSGPILTTSSKPSLVRFLSQKSILFSPEDSSFGAKNGVFQAAGPSTVGGSGLGLRYANVILLAEKYLDKAVTIGDDAREDLYRMLPATLKTLVRSKLSKIVRAEANDDGAVAEGWREALRGIMGWLTPMARDTLKWQAERKFEKVKFDCKPSVLLLQTLHFSDKEKVETAIAEVLVGLSYIYRHQNRPSCGGVRGGG